MTKTAERLLATMRRLAEEGTWTRVPGNHGFTIRHDRTERTPEYVLCTEEEHIKAPFGRWPEPEYKSMIFLTLTYSGVIIRTAPAPWVGARDSDAPYWLAEAILADPYLGHDDNRMMEMRQARKAKR